MTYLVTGVGHSGTTFYARLLMELGADFGQGDPPAPWTEGRHAMEHPAIAKAAHYVLRDQGGLRALPEERKLSEPAFNVARAAVEIMPPWVKSPSIGYCLPNWMRLGLEVEAAVLVIRPCSEIARSISAVVKDRSYEQWLDRAYGLLGMIVDNLERANAVCYTVPFPPNGLADVIGLSDLAPRSSRLAINQAWQNVYRSEWVS